jgi:serine protease Do
MMVTNPSTWRGAAAGWQVTVRKRLMLALAAGVTALALWPTQPQAQTATPTPTIALPDFTELVERVGPAVVNIRTLERRQSGASGRADVDPRMEEFFRRFGIPMPGQPGPRQGPRDDGEPQ